MKWCRNRRQYKDIPSKTYLSGSHSRTSDPNDRGSMLTWATILPFLPILCACEKTKMRKPNFYRPPSEGWGKVIVSVCSHLGGGVPIQDPALDWGGGPDPGSSLGQGEGVPIQDPALDRGGSRSRIQPWRGGGPHPGSSLGWGVPSRLGWEGESHPGLDGGSQSSLGQGGTPSPGTSPPE